VQFKKVDQLVPEHDQKIIGFLLLHGCRPSEARALLVKDVNFDNLSITIPATFSGRLYREESKGKKSRSVTIPIHPEMVEYISERVKNNPSDAYIFVNRQGKPYSENALRPILDAVKTKAL